MPKFLGPVEPLKPVNALVVSNSTAIQPVLEEVLAKLPPNFRTALTEALDSHAQQMVRDIPGFTQEQMDQYESTLWSELGTAMGAVLSQQVSEKMNSPAFAKSMRSVISTGKMPMMYTHQLTLVNQLIDQRLDVFKERYFKEFEEFRKKRDILRRKEIDELREKERIVWYTRKSWALAFTETWALWLAFAIGALIAFPAGINWPAAVGCDRHDLVCTLGRVRDVKRIR